MHRIWIIREEEVDSGYGENKQIALHHFYGTSSEVEEFITKYNQQQVDALVEKLQTRLDKVRAEFQSACQDVQCTTPHEMARDFDAYVAGKTDNLYTRALAAKSNKAVIARLERQIDEAREHNSPGLKQYEWDDSFTDGLNFEITDNHIIARADE